MQSRIVFHTSLNNKIKDKKLQKFSPFRFYSAKKKISEHNKKDANNHL